MVRAPKCLKPVMDGSMTRKRTGIHSVERHGEAASANKEAAESYVTKFGEHVEAEGLFPQQVFN